MMRTGSTVYSPIRSSQLNLNQINSQHEHENSSSIEFIDNNNNTRTPNEPQEEEVVEEVYVCNCCGVTKELVPTLKFMSTFKCVFFLANFLVFAFGLANFGMGLWFRIDPKVYEIHKYIETQNFTIAGWLMLFCGFSACLISLIGFIAAARQAFVLLVFYFTITTILTITFVGTLVLLTVYGLGSTLEYFITKEIYEQMRRRAMNTEVDAFMTADATQFMDFIQVKMRCCGAADFRDYLKLGMSIPTTCYTIDKNYVSAPGCGHSIRELLDLRAGLATGFTLGSIIVQLMAIISSALIFCSVYHWRAIPKATQLSVTTPEPQVQPQVVYMQRQVPRTRDRSPQHNHRSSSSSSNNQNSYNLHTPRSRTPIVI